MNPCHAKSDQLELELILDECPVLSGSYDDTPCGGIGNKFL